MTTYPTAQEYSNLITPDQAQENLIAYLDRINDPAYVGLKIGMETIDDFLTPLSQSDMMCIIARPSNMKSSMLIHYAIMGAQSAVQSKNTNIKFGPPLFITAETTTEELSIKLLSNYSNIDSRMIRGGKYGFDRKRLIQDIEGMSEEYPVVFVGHSVINPRKGLITIEYIERAVGEYVNRYGCPPRVILLDYLQRIATRNVADRRLGLAEVVEKLKDLHMSVGAPLVFGSQAGRQVDDRPIPIPETHDGKETGSIEETADVVVSTMRPCKYWPIGSVVPKTSPERVITDDLFYIKVLKQRNGDSNQGFWVSADPRITSFNELKEIDV